MTATLLLESSFFPSLSGEEGALEYIHRSKLDSVVEIGAQIIQLMPKDWATQYHKQAKKIYTSIKKEDDVEVIIKRFQDFQHDVLSCFEQLEL